MDEADSRRLFAAARIAHLATADRAGRPHIVPVTFALSAAVLYTCVDAKPKSTRRLRRLDNIRETGRVSLLVDWYEEDWDNLWWVRLDGAASVVEGESDSGAAGLDALVAKYVQYQAVRPLGPVIVVTDLRWRGWSARPVAPGPG